MADFATQIEVFSSTFASDWHSMLSDTSSADVTFLFSDGQTLEAHKTVLASSSSIFKNIFLSLADWLQIMNLTVTVVSLKTFLGFAARNE